MYLISGSEPRLPIIITLFKPRAMLPPVRIECKKTGFDAKDRKNRKNVKF
jgi:hypothetical protein